MFDQKATMYIAVQINLFIASDVLIHIYKQVDPDEMAPRGTIWSGSVLFAILFVSSVKKPAFSDQWNGPNQKIEESILESQGWMG